MQKFQGFILLVIMFIFSKQELRSIKRHLKYQLSSGHDEFVHVVDPFHIMLPSNRKIMIFTRERTDENYEKYKCQRNK